jgi:hypothetical protein
MDNLYDMSLLSGSTLSKLHLLKTKRFPCDRAIETAVCNPLRERRVTGYGIFHTMSKKGDLPGLEERDHFCCIELPVKTEDFDLKSKRSNLVEALSEIRNY